MRRQRRLRCSGCHHFAYVTGQGCDDCEHVNDLHPKPRLPWADLERVLHWRAGTSRMCGHGDAGMMATLTNRVAGELVGFDRREVSRWRIEGGIPIYQADRAAVALGLLPCQIWSDAWWALTDYPVGTVAA
jgi:hypothetical protein